jgi:transposase
VAQQRLPVRKIREVLRLKAAGFSDRKIASAIGSARSTVQEFVRRAHESGINWPLSDDLDERALQGRLYRRSVPLSSRSAPDFAAPHAELSRQGGAAGGVAVQRLLRSIPTLACHPGVGAARG